MAIKSLRRLYSATSLIQPVIREGGGVSYALVYDSVVGLHTTEDSKRSVRVYERHNPEDESGQKMQISAESVSFRTASPYSAASKNKSTIDLHLKSL